MATPSHLNMALYRLLVKGGASEADAEEAARLQASDLATKADLRQLKADLQSFLLPLMFGMTVVVAFFAGLVCLLAHE